MNDLDNFLIRISNWVSSIAKVLIAASLVVFAITTLTADLYIGFQFYVQSAGLSPIVAIGLEGFPQLLANFLNFYFVVRGRTIQELSLSGRQWLLFGLTAVVAVTDAYKDAYYIAQIVPKDDLLVVGLAVATTFVASMFGESLLLFLPAMIIETVRGIDVPDQDFGQDV